MARLAYLLLLVTLTAWPGGEASFLDPHLPSYNPSFSEVWYVRILTDLENSERRAPRSLGVIFGQTPRALRSWNGSEVMILIQQNKGDALKIRENVNPEFNVSSHGHEITENPDINSPPNFEITAASSNWNDVLHASFDKEDCSITATIGSTELEITCDGDSDPYGPEFESPEGSIFSRFGTGIVGLHWYVHSLGTPVTYTLRNTDGVYPDDIVAKGWMHVEKNWGESFPDGWIWAQGTTTTRHSSEKNGKQQQHTSFVLAGGVPPSPLLPSGIGPEIYLASIHVGDQLQWRLHPWDPSIFSVEIEACGDDGDPEPYSTLKFNVKQPLQGREVEIFIKAPLYSFSSLNCPTKHGFAPDSDHSYTGMATVQLFTLKECQGFWCKKERVMIHSEVFEDVALEFGGQKRCEYRNREDNKEEEEEPEVAMA
jgi:hypothetical protein